MKKYSTISEISKLLGLSTDTIRFYEKKGLVHPHVNPENNYRMYTLMNVLELLDVIYYRHLDFPLSDIYELSKTLKPSYTIELIEKKEEETKRKIYYEQQLLKKISHIKSMFHMIEHHENECSIQDFKESIILFEGKDKEDIFIHDIQYMTQDQFVLCAFYTHYELKKDQMELKRTFVSIETQLLQKMKMKEELKNSTKINKQKCVYRAVRMKDGKVSQEDIEPMKAYAKDNGLKLKDHCLIREIPVTFYTDYEHYYAEIFLPIKNS